MKDIPYNNNIEIHIRVAQISDLSEIVTIYNQAIPTRRSTANTIPWTFESRKTWFGEHEPDHHPIFVAEVKGQVVGWCSLSVYRPGRFALRFTSEISYYVENSYQHQGVGTALIHHTLSICPSLKIKNVIAVIIDRNEASRKLLEKLGFDQWAFLPRVLDFDGQEFGEYYYGLRIND